MALPHVIGIHQAARFVESPGRRPGLGLIAEMPFAEDGCAIATGLEDFPEGGIFWVKSTRARRERAEDLRSARVTSGEKR